MKREEVDNDEGFVTLFLIFIVLVRPAHFPFSPGLATFHFFIFSSASVTQYPSVFV